MSFKEITYNDTNDYDLLYRPVRKLCSKLTEERCIVTKRFCKGEHNLKITAIDKADNSQTIHRNITIEL